jgi:hypothetical protein
MSTCGYICPQCEGKGFLDDGTPCDWCGKEEPAVKDDEGKELANPETSE